MSTDAFRTSAFVRHYASLARPMVHAAAHETVRIGHLRLRIPGSRRVRASVLAGTVRVRAVMEAVLYPGATVIDVGANIGYLTALAAVRVGHGGRVVAVEPADDNLAVLRENVRVNALDQVRVVPAAAGARRESRELFLRGPVSAVNSLYPRSCYGPVTSVMRVPVVPLDELVDGAADFVKVDVEGGELEVLDGMPRLLASRSLHLVVEWHPALQRTAGHDPLALPMRLLEAGLAVVRVGDISARPLSARDLPALADRLSIKGRPVELYARRTR